MDGEFWLNPHSERRSSPTSAIKLSLFGTSPQANWKLSSNELLPKRGPLQTRSDKSNICERQFALYPLGSTSRKNKGAVGERTLRFQSSNFPKLAKTEPFKVYKVCRTIAYKRIYCSKIETKKYGSRRWVLDLDEDFEHFISSVLGVCWLEKLKNNLLGHW